MPSVVGRVRAASHIAVAVAAATVLLPASGAFGAAQAQRPAYTDSARPPATSSVASAAAAWAGADDAARTCKHRAAGAHRAEARKRSCSKKKQTGRRWMSGASGDQATNGTFGAWRGRPVDITGTWNDNFESQEDEWSLRPGFSLGSWNGNADDAIGAIFKDRGETWAAAAAGAYDARWRNTLTNLASLWANRNGTLYIRFAHEFNGSWYPWSVTAAEASDFKTAWRRFRALQLSIMPQAKLVFCPNADTSASAGFDWRQAFPGPGQVDVIGVDYYNQYPFVARERQFKPTMARQDQWGAPRGLEQFRRFAQAQNLPFAIPEWSSNADFGDSPAFMAKLHAWLKKHGGRGPGQVLYEIQFDVSGYNTQYQLYPQTRQHRASRAYRRLW